MAEPRPPHGVDEGGLRPTPRPDGVLTLEHTIAALGELDENAAEAASPSGHGLMPERRPPHGVDEGRLRPTPRPDGVLTLDHTIAALGELDANGLCLQWRNCSGGTPPAHLPRWLLMRVLAYRLQTAVLGGLDKETVRVLRQPKGATAALSRLRCTSRSRTSPSSSTARQSQNRLPARPSRRDAIALLAAGVDSEVLGRTTARTSIPIAAPFRRRHPDRAPQADLQRRDS
jgi:Protein of unknown function (DUF2924)